MMDALLQETMRLRLVQNKIIVALAKSGIATKRELRISITKTLQESEEFKESVKAEKNAQITDRKGMWRSGKAKPFRTR